MLRKDHTNRISGRHLRALAREVLTLADLPVTRANRRRYIVVTGRLNTPGTVVSIGGFEWLLTDQSAQVRLDQAVTRWLGPTWRLVRRGIAGIAQYERTAGLPGYVQFDPTVPGGQRRIPIGKDAGGAWVHIDLDETPHVQVAGYTGRGVTSFLKLLAAWLAGNNANVTICDPKFIGFTRAFEGLPDITLWRRTEHITGAVRRFRESMEEYAAAEQRNGILDPDAYPTRVLVVDGIDAVLGAVRADRRLTNGDRGYATDYQAVVDDLSFVAMVGRAYRHHLVLASHLPTVLNSQLRDDLGLSVAIGPTTRQACMYLFGPGAKVGSFDRGRGRALVGIRGYAQPLQQVQLAHINDEQATSLALVGPLEPEAVEQ